MAVDMFMKIERHQGRVASTTTHKDAIEVLSWSWGMTQSGTTHMGTRRRRGQGERAGPVVHEVHRHGQPEPDQGLLQRHALQAGRC